MESSHDLRVLRQSLQAPEIQLSHDRAFRPGDTPRPPTKLARSAWPALRLRGVGVMMVVMMVVMQGISGRRADHREEQYRSKNLLHRLHPSMASISGGRPIP
jgi:hypothetical protein